MNRPARSAGLVLIGLVLGLAACSGAGGVTGPPGEARSTPAGGTPETPAAVGGSDGAQAGGGGGTAAYEGTVASSGVYSATWSVAAGQADPFNSSNNPSMTSDKGTYGNIKVMPDGSISFGSGAPELGANGSFTGTGAKVTLDKSGQFVCAFTVDNDLKGGQDSAILHLTGGITFHWHPEGIGDISCP